MPGRQDLVPGKPLEYGVSITDACIGWDATVDVLRRWPRRSGRGASRLPTGPDTPTRDRRCPLKSSSSSLSHRAAVPRIADLARHPAVLAARAGRWRASRIIGTYYDTPDFALERAGVTLRLRRDGARWVQTVKGPPLAGAGGAVHARDEHEWPLARPRLDTARLARTPWRKVFAKAQKRGALAPVFVTDIRRRALPLAFNDGTAATFAIDVGAIRARHPRAPRAGCRNRDRDRPRKPRRLHSLALALLDDWPLRSRRPPRRARVCARARRSGNGAAFTRGRPIRSGGPVTSLARRRARLLRQSVMRRGWCPPPTREWVYQMRIGTRRLRSCLGMSNDLRAKRVAPLVKEVRWLAPFSARHATGTCSPSRRCRCAVSGARQDSRARRTSRGRRSGGTERGRKARGRRSVATIPALCRCRALCAEPADTPGHRSDPHKCRREAARAPARQAARARHGAGGWNSRRAARGEDRRQEAPLRGRVLLTAAPAQAQSRVSQGTVAPAGCARSCAGRGDRGTANARNRTQGRRRHRRRGARLGGGANSCPRTRYRACWKKFVAAKPFWGRG